MLVSWDCSDRLPKTWQLKTTKNHSLTVLEARGLKSKHQCLSEGTKGGYISPLSLASVVVGNPWLYAGGHATQAVKQRSGWRKTPTNQGPSQLAPSITHLDLVVLHYTIGFAFACIVAKG